MIEKIKHILGRNILADKHKCCICHHRYPQESMCRMELSTLESNLLSLVLGQEYNYPNFPTTKYWVCSECVQEFEKLKSSISLALADNKHVNLKYGNNNVDTHQESSLKIRSHWHASKEMCEDDLRALAIFYKGTEVHSIECLMNEKMELPEIPSMNVGQSRFFNGHHLPSFEPIEYIYKMIGYITISQELAHENETKGK